MFIHEKLKSVVLFLKINKKESYVNTRVKKYKGLKQKSSSTLPPDLDSVTQAIKRFNLQIKMLLQSLNQNMAFSYFVQND